MESSTAGDVQIVSRRLVRPEPASSPDKPPEVIHLTPWDLTLITLDQIQKGILLPKPQTTGGAVLADELASSLARTLGRFYPLSGRLAASEITGGESESAEPGPCLAISLRCTGEGAEFIHAVAPGVTVSDIVTPLYTPPVVSSSFFPLNRLLNVEAVVGSLPVLAAQVTELADGVFVAVSLNHGVADGTTFWHLLNAWSEINRRRRRGSGSENEGFELSTPPPVMDRWFVDACPVPVPLPFRKPEDLVRRPEYTPVQECFLHFSAESVKKLKAKANAEMAGSHHHHALLAAVPAGPPLARAVPRPAPGARPGDDVRARHRAPWPRAGHPAGVRGQRGGAARRGVHRRGGAGRGRRRAGARGVAAEPRRGVVRRGEAAARPGGLGAGAQHAVRDAARERRARRHRQLPALRRLRQRLRVGPPSGRAQRRREQGGREGDGVRGARRRGKHGAGGVPVPRGARQARRRRRVHGARDRERELGCGRHGVAVLSATSTVECQRKIVFFYITGGGSSLLKEKFITKAKRF